MTAKKGPEEARNAALGAWRRGSRIAHANRREIRTRSAGACTARVGVPQADAVSALEAAVKRDGVMIAGAAGQRRLNGAGCAAVDGSAVAVAACGAGAVASRRAAEKRCAMARLRNSGAA